MGDELTAHATGVSPALRAQEFTPGPWDYEDPSDACCGWPCTVDGCHESHPTGQFYIIGPPQDDERGRGLFKSEADARLIAAAPELYEALNEIVRFEDENLSRGEFLSPASYDEMFARARAALRKANRPFPTPEAPESKEGE